MGLLDTSALAQITPKCLLKNGYKLLSGLEETYVKYIPIIDKQISGHKIFYITFEYCLRNQTLSVSFPPYNESTDFTTYREVHWLNDGSCEVIKIDSDVKTFYKEITDLAFLNINGEIPVWVTTSNTIRFSFDSAQYEHHIDILEDFISKKALKCNLLLDKSFKI